VILHRFIKIGVFEGILSRVLRTYWGLSHCGVFQDIQLMEKFHYHWNNSKKMYI
jgi:hypothetical protein